MPFLRLAFVGLISLCLAVSVSAQGEPPKTLSLDDAKTIEDVNAYIQDQFSKHDTDSLDRKALESVRAGIFIPTGNKMLEIARDAAEKYQGYSVKYTGLIVRVQGEVDERKIELYLNELETFLDELASKEEAIKEGLPEDQAKHVSEWQDARFFLFLERAKIAEASPETFNQFKAEFKKWLNHPCNIGFVPNRSLTAHVVSKGLPVAVRNNVPAEQYIKEMIEYVQSPQCTIPEERKERILADLEIMTRIEVGIDPKLYGKTLDGKDFKWESLREKYVLIKFTATWCGPCKQVLPDMLEAYKKYHNKGLEIVSIYIGQDEPDPVATVKESVEEEKLPWIIISEALTEKDGLPKQSEYYRVYGVPKIVLVGKDGRIIMMNPYLGMGGTHPDGLNTKLAEIFE